MSTSQLSPAAISSPFTQAWAWLAKTEVSETMTRIKMLRNRMAAPLNLGMTKLGIVLKRLL
jgi:hypothetical protein